MRLTVDDVQSRVAAIVDQDQNTANISSTDYSLRLSYINMALKEWGEIAPHETLLTEYNMRVSTSTGNASIVLPNDFRKLAGYPFITYDGTSTEQFPEVLLQENRQYIDTDRRVVMLGNPNSGYIMRVFGSTLASGASVQVQYYRSPTSLVSPANIADIPNVDYLVQRTIAHIWEAREDPRFPQAKAEAERILSNLIEYENVFNRASQYDRVKTVDEVKYNFVIGRD